MFSGTFSNISTIDQGAIDDKIGEIIEKRKKLKESNATMELKKRRKKKKKEARERKKERSYPYK